MVNDHHVGALKRLNTETLYLLQAVLLRMDQRLYTHVNSKGRASVGQHVRHTIEFYQCLFEASDLVNYDTRKRDILLESSPEHASVSIDEIIKRLNKISVDFPLHLAAELPGVSEQLLTVPSSFNRELFYVLEHTIHHMALMRILIKDEAPDFELEESFGVAYSTLAFRGRTANS